MTGITTATEPSAWARLSLAQADQRSAIVGVEQRGDSVPVQLTLTPQCPAYTRELELFASVADTSRLATLAAGTDKAAWTLDVPLVQLEWLTPARKACENAATHREPDVKDENFVRWYRLQAGTQAYASLTCVGAPPERATQSASIPIELWLTCPQESPK